ncbi:MAG: 2,3-bisphosphoglycerate-independent phosphoglycerate mutase [Pyrinomonadaceae bacterium]
MDQFQHRPLALLILDGWGIAPSENTNAIAAARTPYYDEICARYPMTTLDASGEAVGLPAGSPGNAESGHLNIGTGRIAKPETVRISEAIRSDEFFENEVLKDAYSKAKASGNKLHLVGLFSDAEVHCSPEVLFSLLRMAKRFSLEDVFIHGILDGRDVPPRTADIYTEIVEIKMADIGIGRIASLCGRFFAMDSSENWERTARAYTMLMYGEGEHASDPGTAIRGSFLRGISDEFTAPIIFTNGDGEPLATIGEGDTVIFFNHRLDTMRQLVRSVAMPEPGASVKPKLNVVCLTEYDASFGLPVAFRSGAETQTFGDILENSRIHAYRISETERAQHISNVFDGGASRTRQNEKYLTVESAKDFEREYAPELQNFKVTSSLLRHLETYASGIFIANFASPGLVAETGNFQKTVEAVQYADTCLGGIINKINRMNGVAVITSSHGNCEDMRLIEGQHDRAATMNRVPLHITANGSSNFRLAADGKLCDVAPTILGLLGVAVPTEMSGRDLRM